MVSIVKCPTCGKDVRWVPENRFRPFCSERCKQIDLGAWANEKYRIGGGEAPSDDDDPLSANSSGGDPSGGDPNH